MVKSDIQNWCLNKIILQPISQKKIKTLAWPINSRDLNPIENIWNLLKKLHIHNMNFYFNKKSGVTFQCNCNTYIILSHLTY